MQGAKAADRRLAFTSVLGRLARAQRLLGTECSSGGPDRGVLWTSSNAEISGSTVGRPVGHRDANGRIEQENASVGGFWNGVARRRSDETNCTLLEVRFV